MPEKKVLRRGCGSFMVRGGDGGGRWEMLEFESIAAASSERSTGTSPVLSAFENPIASYTTVHPRESMVLKFRFP